MFPGEEAVNYFRGSLVKVSIGIFAFSQSGIPVNDG